MNIFWFLLQILPTLGFLLALVLLLHLIKEQRPASSTIAWMLAIILFPYAGVPLYIIFGGRKMKKMNEMKEILLPAKQEPQSGKVVQGETMTDEISNRFPLRKGNQVTLLSTGEEAFRTLMRCIENAQQSIYITTFILGNDDTGDAVIEALTAKARNGVEVCLLLDALGSHAISDSMLKDFREAGGKYAFFMPLIHIPFRGRANLRNHRKMVLIDRTSAIIGGMNLAHEYMGEKSDSTNWRDLSVSIQGPIVNDLFAVFQSDWKFAADEELPVTVEQPHLSMSENHIPLQVIPSGPDVKEDTLYDTILTSIFKARKRIWIVTPYFIPDEILIKALCIVARRNVDVRIVVPRVSNHRLADMVRRNYLRQVQDAGGKIYLYKPGMMHGKVMVIDSSSGIVGSMNMDMRSFFLNYEIALFIYSKQIIEQLDKWIYDTMQKSETGMKNAPVLIEYIEGIARLLSPLL